MGSGPRNGLCMVAVAVSVMGCAGAELFQAAGTTALGFMMAPFPQTYRLPVDGMALPAGQLEGNAFPERLRKNIYLSGIDGTEVLKHLDGIRLDKHDTGNVKAALRHSLDLAGLLNDDPNAARYHLGITVTENQSEGFADTTVTTRMQFVLTDAVTGEMLLNMAAAAPSTVPVSEEPLYKDRVGKAMAGSVRGDIRALLEQLRRAPVDAPASPPVQAEAILE